MTTWARLFCAMVPGALFLAGCATTPVAMVAPQESTKYTVENTESFVVLDPVTQSAVTCTGLQERPLADGRLDVVADVQNRDDHRIEVQVQCVFKSGQGYPLGDETAWQNVSLPEYSTETVHFTAASGEAKRYTIRVRQSRQVTSATTR